MAYTLGTSENNMAKKSIPLIILLGVAVIFLLIAGFSSMTVITAGYVGVVKKFGEVQPNYLPAGLHFVTPFVSSVAEIDIRIGSVSHGSVAFSKDLQTVNSQASLQYGLEASLMPLAIKTIGDRSMIEAVILEKAILESLKSETSKFTAKELITKRELVKIGIRKAIENYMKTSTTKYELEGLIEISNLAITDFQFSSEFNKAIEAKVKAEQQALQAQNEKKKLETEAFAAANQTKIAADAERYKIEAMANAEAYQMQKVAEARARAIKVEAQALKNNPDLLKLRMIEQWDGKLPKYNGGEGVPLLDIGDILGDQEK